MKPCEEVRHIITTIDLGGAENQLLLLAEMQIKSGLSVEIVYLKGQGELQSSFEELGASVIDSLANKNFTKQIFLLRKLNRNFKGVIHLHLPQAELAHRLTFLKKVTVTSRHYGNKFSPRSNFLISVFLSNFAASGSNSIIAISNHVSKYLLSSREVIRNGKIVTVTYGFNKESYLKRKRNIINITNNVNSKAIKIGCVARLSEEKNHITLFRAVKQLKDDNYDVILYLAGEGDYRHHLEKETDILGITANVLFLGKIDYIPDLISAMDLLVLPSIFEGFGMIIMEALANEKVIICANNSAMSEILESDLPDTLFKTFDYLDLANKILKHSAKPSEENYNQRFNLILSRFSSEIMNQKILNIYNSILNTKRV